MIFTMTVFAYLGPETILPMTSAVAGVAGLAMLFGRNALRMVSRTMRGLVAMVRPKPKSPGRFRKIGSGSVGRIESSGRDRVGV